MQIYNRGLGIIRHSAPKVAAIDSFGNRWNLTSDNKANSWVPRKLGWGSVLIKQ